MRGERFSAPDVDSSETMNSMFRNDSTTPAWARSPPPDDTV